MGPVGSWLWEWELRLVEDLARRAASSVDNARLFLLQVHDEGIGIGPGNLSRIFERSERAVSERHYGGLGLGLYITRTLVQALGGTMEARSTPGAGSTFSVSLPGVYAEHALQAPAY